MSEFSFNVRLFGIPASLPCHPEQRIPEKRPLCLIGEKSLLWNRKSNDSSSRFYPHETVKHRAPPAVYGK